MQTGSPRVLGILLFTLIGASALVLGVMNTGQSISTPMQADLSATQQFSNAVNGTQATAPDATLKNKDTDSDGLSDYDELYFYHSSPYIKDSDSDGMPDGTEVKNGTDPNCPQGQDCGVPEPSNANKPPLNIDDIINGASADASSLLPDIASGTIPTATVGDAASIRAMLKEQGMTDDMLSAIDDQTLIDMYNESAKSLSNVQLNNDVNAKSDQ